MEKRDVKNFSPLALAFMGDAVYEQLVRERILRRGNANVADMHKMKIAKVCAAFQSAAVERVLPLLDEDELAVYKRGRNTGGSVPRNADTADYRRATGLESLFGYLHLLGHEERKLEIFGVIFSESELENF